MTLLMVELCECKGMGRVGAKRNVDGLGGGVKECKESSEKTASFKF